MNALVLLGVVVGAVLTAAALALAVVGRAEHDVDASRGGWAQHRSGGVAGVAAVAGVVSALACVELLGRSPLVVSGVGLLLAPVAFALTHTGVVALSQLTSARSPLAAVPTAGVPAAGVPTAGRPTAGGPVSSSAVALPRLLALAAASPVVVAVLGVMTAAPDGRSIERSVAGAASRGGDAVASLSAGPYPGPVFAVPALLGTAAVVCAVLVVLRMTAGRTAGPGDPLHEESVQLLLRGAITGLLVMAGGLWGQAGLALQVLADGPGSIALVSGASAVLLLVAVAHGVAAVATLCLPSPRLLAAVVLPHGSCGVSG